MAKRETRTRSHRLAFSFSHDFPVPRMKIPFLPKIKRS